MVDFDSIKDAFLKVKEDIQRLEKELAEAKKANLEQKEAILALNKKIGNLLSSDKSLELNNNFLEESSIGNDGVLSTSTVSTVTPSTTFRQSFDSNIDDNPIVADIKKKFQSLTEREFAVFAATYQLEEEFGSQVTYADLAVKLSLSRSSIRDHVGELLLKKVPLIKHQAGDRKVSLSIKKDFRDLNVMSQILTFRGSLANQRQLSSF
ncbi:MAG: hypothetical protein Q8R00_03860 [Candidatus Nanoarchaeia archaeon]|nr:hypothetical protein [Candidatus Nanoarchaeia archaeon]